jgi:hypothetical protein
VASAINNYAAFPASPGTFSACTANSYTYTWSNGAQNQLKLTSFTANAKTYVVSPGPLVTIRLRRVDNANVTGTRSILYSEAVTGPASACIVPRQLDFKAPYNDDMASFLNNYILNHGTDNIFTNASNGDGNNNNIERVDVIFNNGISTSFPTDAGFVLCERGNNNAHDGFRIAAILSISLSGDPTSFGPVKTCVPGNGSNNGSWGHPSLANGNKVLAAYVLRKDPADAHLRVSSNVNQELGGVFFSFSDLGVSANQTIYGYCLIGPDGIATPSSAQLLNTSDATVYPTGTTEAQGGGLDLISINTFYGTNQALAKDGIKLFNGKAGATGAILNWRLDELAPGTSIYLERSDNSSFFIPVYSYKNESITSVGSYKDNPGAGTWYYRLRIQPIIGPPVYSAIAQVHLGGKNEWRIYPSLVHGNESITIEGLDDGYYEAQFQQLSGNYYKLKFKMENGKGHIAIPAGAIPSGMHYLVVGKNGRTIGKGCKIIVQN